MHKQICNYKSYRNYKKSQIEMLEIKIHVIRD